MEGANDFVFFAAVVHWQAIGPLLRVGARYIFMDQLLGLARLINPAPLLRYWGHILPAGRSRSQKCSVADPPLSVTDNALLFRSKPGVTIRQRDSMWHSFN
jgi:hypothetical protein